MANIPLPIPLFPCYIHHLRQEQLLTLILTSYCSPLAPIPFSRYNYSTVGRHHHNYVVPAKEYYTCEW